MESNIMVSICCATYNHEKYLAKTLEGFVNQKANFKYEILVHDDASSDGTAEIIKRYCEKYPELIKPIYQEENQYSKGKKITFTYLYPRVKGKYVALCEGDDFWCDEYKLQKQVDIMEKNPECSICVHTVGCIKENGEKIDCVFPEKGFKKGVTRQEDFVNYMLTNMQYTFQTSSFFFRSKFIKELVCKLPEFITVAKVGDVPLLLFLATKGGVYYLPDKMSVYRRFSIGSWTKIMNENRLRSIEDIEANIAMYKKYDKYTQFQYKKLIQSFISKLEFNKYISVKRYAQEENKYFRKVQKQLSKKEKLHNTILFLKIFYIYPIYQSLKKLHSGKR